MSTSFQKNRKGILLMFVSSVCVCVGQLFWKMSVQYGLVIMLVGFCFYSLGAMIMIAAYRFGNLSVLQPMLSMNYVLSIILAATVLKENITLLKCFGILTIVVGVVFIAGGDEE